MKESVTNHSQHCHPEEIKWLFNRREDLDFSTALKMTSKGGAK